MSIDPNETRRLVEEIAESLGASRAAIFKWRQRVVPHEWRIRIVEASNKMLTFADFENLHPFRGDESSPVAARPPAHEAQETENLKGAA